MCVQGYVYSLQGAPFTQTRTSPFHSPAFAGTSNQQVQTDLISSGPHVSKEPKTKAQEPPHQSHLPLPLYTGVHQVFLILTISCAWC